MMNDTLDKILEIGSTPDWITPTCAMIHSLFGYSKQFGVYRDSWNDTEYRLRRKGIKPRFVQIIGNTVVFNVNIKQARFAKWIVEHGK